VRLLCIPLLSVWHQGGDADFYLATGQGIAQYFTYGIGGEPTALRVPGYSAFVALMGMFAGPVVSNVIIGQCLVTLGVAVYVHRYWPWWGYVVAASPFGAFMDFELLSESLYTSLLLFAVAFTLAHRLRAWRAVVVGIVLGLLVLTRETFLLFPFAFLGLLWWFGRIRLHRAGIALLTFLLVIAPWSARNHTDFGTYSLSKGFAGVALWIGTWETNDRWMVGDPHPPDHVAEYKQAMAGHPDDALFVRLAKERIERNPLGVAATWIIRAPRMWLGTRTEGLQLNVPTGSAPWLIFKSAAFGLNFLILIASMIGFVFAWKEERWRALVMALPPVYLALIMLPFHNTEPRYSMAALPFLYWFGIQAVSYGMPRLYMSRWLASAHRQLG
jgi:hypothetical protein